MKQSKEGSRIALVAIYNSIDFYPPTLNAVDVLADSMDKVIVVEVDNYPFKHNSLPSNVRIHRLSHQRKNSFSRFMAFGSFVKTLRRIIRNEHPEIILFYDTVVGFATYLATKNLDYKPVKWYHSHDPLDRILSKFSLGYISWQFEKAFMRDTQIFSLAADERKAFYPMTDFKGKYFLIPNFPSKKRHQSEYISQSHPHQINLIYQGRISEGHGLEEIIRILPEKINGKTIRLHVLGLVSDEYKQSLESMAQDTGVKDQFLFHTFISYTELPSFTSRHQIGIAIYTGTDQMNSTLGTASNKVSEYAACGLPFLFYNNEHFTNHYKNRSWAFGTDLTPDSLINAIRQIDLEHDTLSHLAKRSFEEENYFEKVFKPALQYAQSLRS